MELTLTQVTPTPEARVAFLGCLFLLSLMVIIQVTNTLVLKICIENKNFLESFAWQTY